MKNSILHFVIAASILALAPSLVSAQIQWGNVDDFTAVSAAGWSEGNPSPNPPVHNAGPGLDGAAGHLQNVSDGAGQGGRWLMFNSDPRWTGDYTAAGVDKIIIDFDNRSGNGVDANLRIALNGGGGWFLSNDIQIADGSGWQRHHFDLLSLSHVAGGTGLLSDTLTNVNNFEILSAVGTPSVGGGGVLRGDNLVADFRVDNITAIPEPGSAALVALGVLGIGLRRRK